MFPRHTLAAAYPLLLWRELVNTVDETVDCEPRLILQDVENLSSIPLHLLIRSEVLLADMNIANGSRRNQLSLDTLDRFETAIIQLTDTRTHDTTKGHVYS